MKFAIYAILLCSACAGPGHNFAYKNELIVKHGFHVRYVENAVQPTNDVNYALWILVSEMSNRGMNPDKLLIALNKYSEQYPIYVIEEEFACESGPYGKCKGEFIAGFPYWRKGSIGFVQNRCIGLSALSHELIHLADFLVRDRIDFMHRNPEFFETGCLWKHKRGSKEIRECVDHSAERTMNRRLCDNLCGGCTDTQLDWQFETPP